MTLDDLNRCDDGAFLAHLDSVFEHAPWVAGRTLAWRPFASADALHAAMLDVVRALPEPALVALLSGHPELAGADARKGTMTLDSIAEQGALSMAELPAEESERWDRLNAAYRAKFGFPFILCVRRHTRASAMQMFERRLQNDRATEMAMAIEEIGRVTRLRLAARIDGHALPRISGQLSARVLDTANDAAAGQLQIELIELSADGRRTVARAITNDDGATEPPLLAGQPLRIGRYELQLHVGDYYRARGVDAGDKPIADVLPVAFHITDAEGDYHLPLAVSPWSCSTLPSP